MRQLFIGDEKLKKEFRDKTISVQATANEHGIVDIPSENTF
jgi:hypothetical protein